ncbi:phosphatase, partial [Mycobacterium tuberculosis]|nr:phosphatase [Mycobacterium tuberculosis]
AASARGVRTVGYADCNDPALFVAEDQGAIETTVPLDDDVNPYLYGPLIEFVLEQAGLDSAPSRETAASAR